MSELQFRAEKEGKMIWVRCFAMRPTEVRGSVAAGRKPHPYSFTRDVEDTICFGVYDSYDFDMTRATEEVRAKAESILRQ